MSKAMTDALEWPRTQQKASGLIDGPAGALEVDVAMPDGAARGVAVICHPHPQYQGSKDNKVVFMLARAATTGGLAAVRFNFRGVGASAGRYDGGVGEVGDARAVCDWAIAQSGLPLSALAGFSFGAAAALRVAVDAPPPMLITVGLPVGYFDRGLPRPDTRWLALFGDADDVIDVRAAIGAVTELTPAIDVQVLHNAGHFLHGRLSDLRDRVVAFLEPQ